MWRDDEERIEGGGGKFDRAEGLASLGVRRRERGGASARQNLTVQSVDASGVSADKGGGCTCD